MYLLLLQVIFLFFVTLLIFKGRKRSLKGQSSKLDKQLPDRTVVTVIFACLTSTNLWIGPVNFPFIGGIMQILLLGEREKSKGVRNACKKYGKIMGFRAGSQEYLMTCDRETMKEILCSPDWTGRFPATPIYRKHTFNKNYGLMTSGGDCWKETRRFVTRKLGEHGYGQLNMSERIIGDEVTAILAHIEKELTQNGNLLRINGLFAIPALNVNWALIAGTRFSYDDQHIHKLLHLIQKATDCDVIMSPVGAFRFLEWIPGISPFPKFEATFKAMYNLINELIQKRRNGNEEKLDGNLIESFLAKIEEEKSVPGTMFTSEQLLVTVADLLAAAMDTTSNTLSFAFLYMMKLPHIQQKVHEELDRALGERVPNVFDRSRLPYTEAVMWETMRISYVFSLLARSSTTNTTVGGYAVKEGVFAVLNVSEMHMDPEVWGDPHNFRPERFLDSDGKVVREQVHFPFGGGRRVCLGQTVGILQFICFFASILQRYKMEVENGKDPSTEPISGFTNSPRPFNACFIPRKITA